MSKNTKRANSALGVISHISINESGSALYILLDNGTLLAFQQECKCCEDRYFASDDDFSDYIGATYLSYELKPVEILSTDTVNRDGEACMAEIAFLEIATSSGTFQVKAYNYHSGAYGDIKINLVTSNIGRLQLYTSTSWQQKIGEFDEREFDIFACMRSGYFQGQEFCTRRIVVKDKHGVIYSTYDLDDETYRSLVFAKIKPTVKSDCDQGLLAIAAGATDVEGWTFKRIKAMKDFISSSSMDAFFHS